MTSRFSRTSSDLAMLSAPENSPLGLASLIHASVLRCDADARRELLNHVVLIGGACARETLRFKPMLDVFKKNRD
jgi:hypothetical protein